MKNFIIFILFVILINIPIISYSQDWESKKVTTEVGYTSKYITVEWDPSVRATSYKIRLKHLERDVYGSEITTTETQYTFQLPRTGHYTFEVKGVNQYGEAPWSLSDNVFVYSNPIYQPFWIYGYTEPPGGPVIGGAQIEVTGL